MLDSCVSKITKTITCARRYMQHKYYLFEACTQNPYPKKI